MLTLVDDKLNLMQKEAHIIVVGNEKGGTGKTTTSIHIIMTLMRMGFKVGCIDIDSRQQSLDSFMVNREKTIEVEELDLDMPEHCFIPRAIGKETVEDIERDEQERFMRKLDFMRSVKDFVIIDTPGNNTFLSRLAHSYADTIITPINDSFVDFDLLAKWNSRTGEIFRPSLYSEMVWNQRMVRAQREGEGKAIDWVVLCNRLSHLDAKNKRNVFKALGKLADRIGFRVAPGVSERVIYRELFPRGLTLMDILDEKINVRVTMSHIAAREEVRDLLRSLNLDKIISRVNQVAENEQVSQHQSYIRKAV